MGRSYRDLIAWQKAMNFVIQIYEVTQKFPTEERYGIANQCDEHLFRYPVILPKDKLAFHKKNSIIF